MDRNPRRKESGPQFNRLATQFKIRLVILRYLIPEEVPIMELSVRLPSPHLHELVGPANQGVAGPFCL